MAGTKKFYNTFRFTGDLSVPNDEKKLIQEVTFDSGWKKVSLKIGVKESKANAQFVNMEAMIPPKDTFELTKPHKDGNGKKVKYQYKDRNSSAVTDNVADFSKIVVDIETDFEKKKERIGLQMKIRNLLKKDTLTDDDKEKLASYEKEHEEKSDNVHKFVNEMDVIDFIKENMDLFKARKVRISGNYSKTTSKGNYYTSYKPTTIELVAADTENSLKVSLDIYFDKDALDAADFKTDKKVYVNGYIKGYDSKAESDVYFPQQFIIDASKLDLEGNDKHKAIFEFIKSTFTVKGKNVFHIPVEFNTYNGSEMVEFTIDMLEPRHRQQVELGLKKLDDYKPKGGFVLGDFIQEFKFTKLLDTDYKDGAEDTEVTVSELEEMVATSSAETVKADDVKVKPPKEEVVEETQEEETDPFAGLFG